MALISVHHLACFARSASQLKAEKGAVLLFSNSQHPSLVFFDYSSIKWLHSERGGLFSAVGMDFAKLELAGWLAGWLEQKQHLLLELA